MGGFQIGLKRIIRLLRGWKRVYSVAQHPGRSGLEGPRKQFVRRYLDQCFILLKWGNVSYTYYAQGVDRVGRSVRTDYLSYQQFKSERDAGNIGSIDDRRLDYTCLLRNKWVFEKYLRAYNLPVTTSIGLIHPGGVFEHTDGTTVNVVDLDQLKDICTVAFCKPVTGLRGTGAFLLDIKSGECRINGELCNILCFTRLDETLICQAPIRQHSAVECFHSPSVNTLRLLTIRERDDERATVVLSYLRMGVNGNVVDNPSAGGIIIRANADGTLEDQGYMRQGDNAVELKQHPGTGVRFKGFKIPFFEEAYSVVLEAHKVVPGVRSIAWDVAITEDGPVLVEGNDDWGAVSPMWLVPEFAREIMTRVRIEGLK